MIERRGYIITRRIRSELLQELSKALIEGNRLVEERYYDNFRQRMENTEESRRLVEESNRLASDGVEALDTPWESLEDLNEYVLGMVQELDADLQDAEEEIVELHRALNDALDLIDANELRYQEQGRRLAEIDKSIATLTKNAINDRYKRDLISDNLDGVHNRTKLLEKFKNNSDEDSTQMNRRVSRIESNLGGLDVCRSLTAIDTRIKELDKTQCTCKKSTRASRAKNPFETAPKSPKPSSK